MAGSVSNRLDPGGEFNAFQRFANKVIGPGGKTAGHVLYLRQCRGHNDGHRLPLGSVAG